MGAPVAEFAGGKIPPRVPAHPTGMVGSPSGRSEPKIPIESRRNGLLALRFGARPGTASVPDMNFLDLAEDTRLDELHATPEVAGRRTLVAHLRGDAVLSRQFADRAGLGAGPGRWGAAGVQAGRRDRPDALDLKPPRDGGGQRMGRAAQADRPVRASDAPGQGAPARQNERERAGPERTGKLHRDFTERAGHFLYLGNGIRQKEHRFGLRAAFQSLNPRARVRIERITPEPVDSLGGINNDAAVPESFRGFLYISRINL